MKKIMKTTAILLTLVLCVTSIISVADVGVVSSSAKVSKTTASAKKKAKKIRLNKKKKTMRAGQTFKLKLKNAKVKKVKWSSSKKKVATVSKKGRVKALKKGKVTITARYKGKKYKCKITVKKAKSVVPTSIKTPALQQSLYLIDKLYNKENIIVSPVSLNMVLGMAANGADTNVKKDLEKYLGKNLEQYNEDSLKLMNRAKDDSMLSLANGVWYKDEYNVKAAFSNAVSRYYNAVVKQSPLDISTVQEINQWASDNTEKMIEKIIEEIPDDTAVILTNALLFKGEWTVPFKAVSTWKENFTQFNGKKVKADMMHSNEYIYYENDYATGFEKTYGTKKQYSFIAILPKVKGEFEMSGLNIEKFLQSKTDAYKVDVSMPKFSYDWNDKGCLTRVLGTTEIKSIFNKDTNPLGNMLQTSDSLYVSDILQTCKIIVDEEGTKAAAVTTTLVTSTTAIENPIPTKTVELNRPFGYIIMDNTTNNVLFMGKVVNPVK